MYETWKLRTETIEQSNRVLDYFSRKSEVESYHYQDTDRVRYYCNGTIYDSDGWTYDSRDSYEAPLITWEQFLELENKLTMKYTLEDLKTKDLLVFLTKEQWTKLNKALGFNITTEYYGEYLYRVKTKDYSCTSTRTYKGGYEEYCEIIDFGDIEFGEIIGYKAPMDLFGGLLKKGEVISRNRIENGVKQYYLRGRASSTAVPSEIVETWEPVYKKLQIEVECGTPLRKFIVKKDSIEVIAASGTYTFCNEDLQELHTRLKSFRFNSFEAYPTSIQIGCSEGTALNEKDVNKLIETQQQLN